jgi:hypothetical protein
MNLSCAKCKTIQPFWGDPPRCYVCGWVLGTELTPTSQDYARIPPPRASRSSDISGGLGCLAGLVIVAAIGFGVYYFLFMPDKDYLASKYNVPVDRVAAPPKPHGCDFDDAPLGNKHCHYEKHVYVFDRNNQVIEIDGNARTCPTGCGPAYRVEQDFQRADE